MSIESGLSIVASILAICGAIWAGYKSIRQKPLVKLMNELADKNATLEKQRKTLRKIQKSLSLTGNNISNKYINTFNSVGQGKINIFRDICTQNNIEPSRELCIQMLGYDDTQFRKTWANKHKSSKNCNSTIKINTPNDIILTDSKIEKKTSEVVYVSALLTSKYPHTCNRLLDILKKHEIPYGFIDGTKDIWCRDYMPIQTPSGKFIQFKYDPTYLKDSNNSDSRSDMEYVNELNHINPIYSNINLDGGNVVMYGKKAIITDRVFSENPDICRDELRNKLAKLLECEIIIIPSLAKSYDFTGHADGMIRFVNENAVIGNELNHDSQTFQNNMKRAMKLANLDYIDFPYFNYKIRGNTEHAIGIYLNYLEVEKLIVMPVFGVPGNRDAEAFAKLKELFPDKDIETIDYNDVALSGGILNCTTWVIKK